MSRAPVSAEISVKMPETYPDYVFASHLPVLAALEPQPRRVLEFGTGYFSTKAFLMMDSVVELTSVEIYDDWREEMRAHLGPDLRWDLLGADDEVPPLLDFDLVFIDDGRNEAERLATIDWVLSEPHPKTVIHDAEYQPFLDAIDRLASHYTVYRDHTPHTAIVEAT